MIVRTSKMFFIFYFFYFLLLLSDYIRIDEGKTKKICLCRTKTRTKHTQKNVTSTHQNRFASSCFRFALLPSLCSSTACSSSQARKIESSWEKKIDWTQTVFSRPNTFYNWSETQPNSTTVGGDTPETSASLCAHRHMHTNNEHTSEQTTDVVHKQRKHRAHSDRLQIQTKRNAKWVWSIRIEPKCTSEWSTTADIRQAERTAACDCCERRENVAWQIVACRTTKPCNAQLFAGYFGATSNFTGDDERAASPLRVREGYAHTLTPHLCT